MPGRHQPLIRCLLPLVWLVALITALGLSRSAVLCTQPCCAGHVKLAPRCDALAARQSTVGRSCCRAAAAPATGCDHRKERGTSPIAQRDGGCGCQHVRLGVELAEPPTDALWWVGGPDGWSACVLVPGNGPLAAIGPAGHPPATGPPPHSRRSAHRATIQLLL